MTTKKKLLLLTVARDGRYLRLHRSKNDFIAILQYRECTNLTICINNDEINVEALANYNNPKFGAISSPDVSKVLIDAGCKPKDKLIAELSIDYDKHIYHIKGVLKQFSK